MPRDGSGNYNLPLADVQSGDPIEALWANTSLDDVAAALTGSLARNGEGGMTGPLSFVDGSLGSPGFSWTDETTMGFRRAGPGDMRASIGGTEISRWNSGVFSIWNGVGWDEVAVVGGSGTVPDGTMDGDTLAWDQTTDQEWKVKAANPGGELPVGTNGQLLRWDQTGSQVWEATSALTISDAGNVVLGNRFLMPDGSAADPSITFSSDLDTGMYLKSADAIGWSTGGVEGMVLDNAGDLVLTVGNLLLAGTVDGRDIDADGTAQDTHIADSSIHVPTTQTGAAPAINAYLSITQADYDALGPPDANTIYFVSP